MMVPQAQLSTRWFKHPLFANKSENLRRKKAKTSRFYNEIFIKRGGGGVTQPPTTPVAMALQYIYLILPKRGISRCSFKLCDPNSKALEIGFCGLSTQIRVA